MTTAPELIEILTTKMKNSKKGPTYDIFRVWFGTGILTSHEASMGYTLEETNIQDLVKYRNDINELSSCIMERLLNPLLLPEITLSFSSLGRRIKQLAKKVHDFSAKIINNRSLQYMKSKDGEIDDVQDGNVEKCDEKKKSMSVIDILLSAKFKDRAIDDTGIQEEVDTIIFGGYDTVAWSLAYTLMLLANNRDCQDKVYEEICDVLPDLEAMPTYNDLTEMKYMERCIKESLRLYPSIPHIARIFDENVTISNSASVPKGCLTIIPIYDVHRIPDIWPNPEKFDPDRFLPENVAQRHPFAYLPFGAGPRICIGHKFAMLEMKCCLTAILKKFILEPVDSPETIRLILDIALRSKNKIKVKFIPRS